MSRRHPKPPPVPDGSREPADRRAAYRRGLAAETLVAWAMRARGFWVIAQRYRTPAGEIDLVARRGRLLVFVEVKARYREADGLDAVTAEANRRILAAADLFLARHPRLAGFDLRFDLAVVAPWRLPVIHAGRLASHL